MSKLHPMRNRYVLAMLFAANLVSGFASGITMLAIPWYLTSKLGAENGKLQNILLMCVVTLLSVFWGLYAGTLIDKYNRKRIFQYMNLADGLILTGSAIAAFYFGDTPFVLIALVTGATLLTYTIFYPNLYAFVQELFEPEYYQRVNSAIEIQNQVTASIGMVIGGVFLAGSASVSWWPQWLAFRPWSLSEVFLLDGITYFMSFLLISLIPYVPGAYRRLSTGGLWERVRTGFQYLRSNRPLLIFGLCSYVIYFSLLVFMQVMLPIYVSDYLDYDYEHGARVVAEFRGVYSAGAFTAGILGIAIASFIGRTNLVWQIIVMITLSGALFFLWSFSDSAWVFTSTAFVIGIFNAGVRILRITYISRIVPNHLIGRTNSFFQIVNGFARTLLILVLLLPFFSAPENGENIIWAMIFLGGVCLFCAGMLVWSLSRGQTQVRSGELKDKKFF